MKRLATEILRSAALKKNDLAIFHGKKIVIYSSNYNVVRLYKTFRILGLRVIGYTVYDENRRKSVKELLENKLGKFHYIDAAQLVAFSNREDIIVQPASVFPERLQVERERLAQLSLNISDITSGEITTSFSHLLLMDDLSDPFTYVYQKVLYIYRRFQQKRHSIDTRSSEALQWVAFQKHNKDNLSGTILICSPPKTADLALEHTFKLSQMTTKENVKTLKFANVWHWPNRIDRFSLEKRMDSLKIVVGVRDPISQNISNLYQRIASNIVFDVFFYRELFEQPIEMSRKALLQKYQMLFGEGIDVQAYWDIYTNLYIHEKQNRVYRQGLIQDFMFMFKDYVLDITAYPFDKEKGYTIIRDGNTEVFVYQLEKLNNLASELSDWVGVPFNKIEKGNDAADKWIAESYEQAKTELEITQEYFDKCFNEPYVKHCYSDADIKQFKEKWRSHIVNV